MIKKILLATATLLGALLVIVAWQPSEYRVSRSATIAAPSPDVFAHVNDLREFNRWSPFAQRDPQAANSYSGPQQGKGASFSWAGNHQVGAGRMTIVESRPNEFVRMKLQFEKPFASDADATFTIRPEGGHTVVTWTMTGEKVFVSKLIGTFISMDKMIGGDFEQGLASLKTTLEASTKQRAAG
jgi:carbon monoxide dehydrogenase subunit G